MTTVDSMHMWDEIVRLKQHVADLQRNERMLLDLAKAAADDRKRFVTHPQLDAGLALKASTTSVPAEVAKLRADLMDAIAAKADLTLVDTIHLKKLDISAFDAHVGTMGKVRVALEQMLKDMFTSFALHVERDVRVVQGLMDVNEKRMLGALTTIEAAKHDHLFLCDRVKAVEKKTAGGSPPDAAAFFRTDDHTTFRTFEAALNAVHAETVASNEATAKLHEKLASMQSSIDAVQQEASKSQVDVSAAIAAEVDKAHAADVKMFRTLEAKQHEFAEMLRRAQDTAALAVAAVDDFKSDASTILQESCDKKVAASMKAMGKETDHLRDMIKRNQYVAAEHTKTVEGMVRCTSQALSALEQKLHALGIMCDATRRDIVDMKGPFLTEVANLKAENGAILNEIRRQQDVSRELVLDYKDLIDQQHNSSSAAMTTTAASATRTTAPLRPQKPMSARRPQSSSAMPVNVTKRFGVVECLAMPSTSSVACAKKMKPRAKTAGPRRTPSADAASIGPDVTSAGTGHELERQTLKTRWSRSDESVPDDHLFVVGSTDPVENAFLLTKSTPVHDPLARFGQQRSAVQNNNLMDDRAVPHDSDDDRDGGSMLGVGQQPHPSFHHVG
ncbi:hypothetical protein, variant 1 [Aphanomyces invadans]|uniref:Uncharacterized protein n=1 Tax=Aphanomyces invadans TaxID=157072 RepID=A0A024UJN3_9STRA|nr:hypothetical protein, variant 1 [Aphanomyces invadans]ETW06499.1 hypothetical protein, variant 1 [Aphanomyces invadans]|eukprot:XP_008864574.1 hypothetical protein, variant 1 [Aphanomyces invadans]